jgi:hypothetical protein
MPAKRRDAYIAGPAHVCHQGCPSKGEAFNDDQAREAYEHHRPELEGVLVRMLAGRKRYAVAWRPRWWWLCAEDAEPYRANPGEYEDPGDLPAPSVVQLELGVRESIDNRTVEQVGRLRFLARHDLPEPWEIAAILSRGGTTARALKEELARKGRR